LYYCSGKLKREQLFKLGGKYAITKKVRNTWWGEGVDLSKTKNNHFHVAGFASVTITDVSSNVLDSEIGFSRSFSKENYCSLPRG
jgi:hypothetical protein